MADQTEGFYRRLLPSSCIAFSSTEGRQLFREALDLGGVEGYFALAEQFHTQAEPAFCGLGTMVVVLNALTIDSGRIGEEFDAGMEKKCWTAAQGVTDRQRFGINERNACTVALERV